MYSHVMVGTNNLDASTAFYDAIFGVLGVPGTKRETSAFYGTPETGMFAVTKPRDGEPATHANGGTIGLKATDPAQIDAWHAAGLSAGGSDEGAPGRRDYGPKAMYGAYLRDPEGNKLSMSCTLNEGT
jgi:catechol 2,3-dioxygenase-like lactoylglutathione lyase family enzyme